MTDSGIGPTPPGTEAEFDALMREIDEMLARKGIARHQRSAHAIGEIADRFSLTVNVVPEPREPLDGVYTGDDLVLRIYAWYENRYGHAALRPTLAPYRIAVDLRHDTWVMKIPNIYGEVGLTSDPRVRGSRTIVNVLDQIEALSDSLRFELTPDERMDLTNALMRGLHFFDEVRPHYSKQLVWAALQDVATAVDRLTQHPPHAGQSKWASLQATEKLLKAFIQGKGQTFPRRHVLVELVTIAEGAGLPPVARTDLAMIQCTASARYGEEAVSREEAVAAHQASLTVGGQALAAI